MYIRLFIKLVNEGGGGVKNPQNSVNIVYGCPLVMTHSKFPESMIVMKPMISNLVWKIFGPVYPTHDFMFSISI